MVQPQVVMPDHVQEQGAQDAPPPVPTVVPTATLLADAVERLWNLLETLVPTQCGIPSPQATLNTQAPAQTQTFGNKKVSLQEFQKLKFSKFIGSDNSVYPQSFLDGTLKALHTLGCSSERLARATPLTWDRFSMFFMDNFLLDNLRHKYARDFERLVRTPDMDVSTYNTKFCNLARYAPYLVPTQEARV
nr:uncharacterized protein LOC117279449 [Nicotiana tomentosiformis]